MDTRRIGRIRSSTKIILRVNHRKSKDFGSTVASNAKREWQAIGQRKPLKTTRDGRFGIRGRDSNQTDMNLVFPFACRSLAVVGVLKLVFDFVDLKQFSV